MKKKPQLSPRRRLVAVWKGASVKCIEGARAREACPSQYDRCLSAFFGIIPGLRMNLQLDYEFIRADREKGDTIREEVQLCAS
jgi:hypothetical protein